MTEPLPARPVLPLATVAALVRREAERQPGTWCCRETAHGWHLCCLDRRPEHALVIRIRALREAFPALTRDAFLDDARRIAQLVEPGRLTPGEVLTRGWFQVVFVGPAPAPSSPVPQEVA